MQASYTRASQWGAIFAIAATALWVYTFSIGDMFAAIGNVAASLILMLLLLMTFGTVAGLYIRLTAARPSPIALIGGICGTLGLVGGLSSSVGWLIAPDNDWSWSTSMLSLGLLALALTIMGIASSGQSELGPLRFAPLLVVGFPIIVVAVVFFYSRLDESIMGPISGLATLSSIIGFTGTAALLWTRAK